MMGEITPILKMQDMGNKNHYVPLWLMFVLSSFTLIVHLMNMIVALLGEKQSQNIEDSEYINYQVKLAFVVENWNLLPFDKKERLRANYLVAGFFSEEEDEEEEALNDLRDDFNSLHTKHND